MNARPLRLLLVIAALAAALYWLGIAPRVRAQRELSQEASAHRRVAVHTIRAEPAKAASTLMLPGNLEAFTDTAIYARTTGYVARWNADLGDQVKAGATLAVIDAPEVDQELNQARANLEQAKANLELARISAERWTSLAKQNAVAQQDVDTRQADYRARQADVAASTANVQRLEQLKSFEIVTAPFDGVVSARNVDVGNLVGPNSNAELFHLTQSRILRVYVDVPQAFVRDIKKGLPVTVTVPEFPQSKFTGQVTRLAGALNVASRTLRTEVQLPNDDRQLLAGMYCELHFSLQPSAATLIIPSNDVIIRAAGTLVAVVTPTHTIHLQPVKLGRDFGTRIEILDGLASGAEVVENPSDSLAEGAEVAN